MMSGIAGITGIIGAGHDQQRQATLDVMLGCLCRTPLDECGTQVDDRLGLWSGWVWGEGAASPSQSLWNERRDILLVFSGEDYREQADLDQLHARGHKFDPENAGYLVHLYEEVGLKFLEKLNGVFRGLLVDLREQKIVLFNDRYGINRLYFHENTSGFYFSSEAKSLLKVLTEVRALDPRGLGEFLSCGCVLQNRTIFRGISLMPGGSAWTFRPGEGVRKECYFDKGLWEQQPILSATEYYEKMKDTWGRVLPRYFGGREKVALSLTGGVDSRMILAWAPRPAGTLPCYTFGGRYRDCADVKISQEVARTCKQSHEVIQVGSEFLSQFPDLAEKTVYISDGAMDVTGTIDLYVQQRERQIAPVRITGTNGGEILRSLVAFKPSSRCYDMLDPALDSPMQAAAATYAQELKGRRLSFTAFKQAPWHMGCKFVVERSQVTLRMPYFDNELIALVYQSPAEYATDNRLSQRLIQDGNPELGRIPTDRGGSMESLPGVAEARHKFQEFTFKAEYAYDYGMPQWLAQIDHYLAPLHPERLFLGRHKFHHFRVFYRDELSKYVKEILLDPRTLVRSLYRRPVLEEIVRSHIGGYRNYTLEIHKLLTIELVQRKLIELN
jgi:asparagine synthase (glutamine-hydrolysing)